MTSRAVFGQWFPWLVLIDTEWARNHVDTIFPESEEQLSFWVAAWITYVSYCAPYDQPLELLRDKYAFAIRQLKTAPKFRTTQYKPADRLGEHLLSFYWRGKISSEEGGLLQTYFRLCDVDAFEHGLEFVGRSLGGNQEIRRDVIERLTALFDSLIDEAESARVNATSLAAFGWWFSTDRLDEQWKMSRLLEVLHHTSRVDPADAVLEHLLPMAERFPLEAAEAVSMMAEGNYEPWDFEYWSPKALAVLEKAVASGRPDVKSVVAKAADRFGRLGRLEFRQFAALET